MSARALVAVLIVVGVAGAVFIEHGFAIPAIGAAAGIVVVHLTRQEREPGCDSSSTDPLA